MWWVQVVHTCTGRRPSRGADAWRLVLLLLIKHTPDLQPPPMRAIGRSVVLINKRIVNHDGTRTRNPQLRRLIRYPLRHAAR